MLNIRSRRSRGFSLIELLIVIAIIMIIMGMAIGPLQQAKIRAQEMAAMKAIQAIHAAQAQYQSQFDRYASTLAELGPASKLKSSATAAGLIGADLASGQRGGYNFALTGGEAGYTVNANPITFGSSGSHTFYSDQTLAIHQNAGADPATADSPEVSPK